MIKRFFDRFLSNPYDRKLPQIPALEVKDMAVWERRFVIAQDAPPVALSDGELREFAESLIRGEGYMTGGGPDIYFSRSLKVLLKIEPPYDEAAIRIYGGKVKTLVALNVAVKREREDELIQQLREKMERIVK